MIRLEEEATKILSSISWQAGRVQNLHMKIGLQDPLEAFVTIDHKRGIDREIHLHFSIPITGLPQEAELGKLPEGTVMCQKSFFIRTSPHMSEMHLLEYQSSAVVKKSNTEKDSENSTEFTRILLRSTSDSPRGADSFFRIDESHHYPTEKAAEIMDKRSRLLTGLLVKLEDDITDGRWLD